MKTNWEFESELALRAIANASDLLLARPRNLSIQMKGQTKDIVTEVDLEVEKLIRSNLSPSRHRIVGEELQVENENLGTTEPGAPFWAIDPIDGTVNYVGGLPFYAVSIGLCRAQEFLTGAVSLPDQKEIYFTQGDQGAYLNGKRLKVSDTQLSDSLVAASFCPAQDEFRHVEYEFFGKINDQTRNCLRLGSAAVNICYVAAKKIQVAYGLRNYIWDIAGALAIAEQAGCRIYLSPTESPNSFRYIVGTPTASRQLLELLQETLLGKIDGTWTDNTRGTSPFSYHH